jgi:hypothetical protein
MSFYEILIYQTKTIKRKQYLIYFDYYLNMKFNIIKWLEKLIDSSEMYDWNERDELMQKVIKMNNKDRTLLYNLLINANKNKKIN